MMIMIMIMAMLMVVALWFKTFKHSIAIDVLTISYYTYNV